jgi:hypothetical protein
MRKIAIVLTLLLLIQAIPIGSLAFASSLSPVDLVNMDEAEIEALSDTDIYNAITSSDKYPPAIDGILKYSGKTEMVKVNLNIDSYRKYRLIVYGVPFEKESNYNGKILPGSESKFLGFNEKGIPVTNDKYPSLPGDKEPYEKKWNHYSGQYKKSWQDVSNTDASGEDITALYKHLLLSGTINDDASDNYTLAYILYGVMGDLKKYLGGDEDTLREKLESVVQLQMLPTFVSKGSFKMTHNTVTDENPTGSKRYDTMEWERLGDIKEHLTIVPENKKIIMLPEQDEVTNKFTVTVHYDDKVSGMDTEQLIKENVELDLGGKFETVRSNNPTFTFTKIYKRDEYNFGTYDIEETGGFYFESIFGDKYDKEGKANFELDVRMRGNIGVQFDVKHEDAVHNSVNPPVYTENGKWDSPDDKVTVVLEDKTEVNPQEVELDDGTIKKVEVISWVWYLKNNDGSYQQLSTTLNPTFTKEVVFGSDYLTDSTGENGVVSELTFKLEAMDNLGNKGEMERTISITQIGNDPPPVEPEKNKPPNAVINVERMIRAGDRIDADGRQSSDPDGRVVAYRWDIDDAEYDDCDEEDDRVEFYLFEEDDDFTINLTVEDDLGLTDDTDVDVQVVNPLEPKITVSGFLKENRKVNLSSHLSRDTKYFRIDDDRTSWKITPLDGQNTNVIKIDGDALGRDIDVLFKEKGRYRVDMTVNAKCSFPKYDDIEYSNSTYKIIEIVPDQKPVAGISVKKVNYRNPDTDGIAVLQVADSSKSLDGDSISHKKWSYAFDSNNDGNFSDEVFNIVSDDNENVVHVDVNHVGKYLFRLEVTEKFGQPTIDKFITPADIKKDDISDIEISEKIAEVRNVAPIVELNILPDEPVEIVVFYDMYDENKLGMNSELDRLRMELLQRKVKANIKMVDVSKDTITIGQGINILCNFVRRATGYFVFDEKYSVSSKGDSETSYDVKKNVSTVLETKQALQQNTDSLPVREGGTFVKSRTWHSEEESDKSKSEYLNYELDVDDANVGHVDVDGDIKTFYEKKDGDRYYDYTGMHPFKGVVEKTFSYAGIVREEISDYKVANIDDIVQNNTLDTAIDKKYAVFLTDKRNTFHYMSEITQNTLKGRGYQLRYSMDSFALELTPDLPKIKEVKMVGSKVYYLTQYGNILSSGTTLKNGSGKSYYELEDSITWDSLVDNNSGIITWDKMSKIDPLPSFQNKYIVMGASDTYRWGTGHELYGTLKYDESTKVLSLVTNISYAKDSRRRETITYNATDIIAEGIEMDKVYYIPQTHMYIYESDGNVSLFGQLNYSGSWSQNERSHDDGRYYSSGRTYSVPSPIVLQGDTTIEEIRVSSFPYLGSDKFYMEYHNDRKFTMVTIKYHNGLYQTITSDRGYTSKEYYLSSGWEKRSKGMTFASKYNYIYSNKNNFKVAKYDDKYNEATRIVYFEYEDDEYEDRRTIDSDEGNVPDRIDILYTDNEKIIDSAMKLSGNEVTIVKVNADGSVQGYGTTRYGELGNYYKDRKTNVSLTGKTGYEHDEGVRKGYSDCTYVYYHSPGWVTPLVSHNTLSSPYDAKNYFSAYEMISTDVLDHTYESDLPGLVDQIVDDNSNNNDKENAYILLDTKATMKSFYSDYENDDLYDYRWDMSHNENYFENNLGKDPRAIPGGNPIEDFPYTGHYKIDLKVRDNPVGGDDRFDNYRLWNKNKTILNIYVHRKPVAKGEIFLGKVGGKYHIYAMDSGSFDIDHQSETNRGIVEHDWYWRTATEPLWKHGKLDVVGAEYAMTYEVAHRVKDKEGQWSDMEYIHCNTKPYPPVALFEIDPEDYLRDTQELKIKDKSTDPNGDNSMEKWTWKLLKKNTSGVYVLLDTVIKGEVDFRKDSTEPPWTDYSTRGIGKYKITLQIVDNMGSVSNLCSREFEVIPENKSPIVDFRMSPDPVWVEKDVNWNESASDPDGNPINISWKFERYGVQNISDIKSTMTPTIKNFSTLNIFSSGYKSFELNSMEWVAYRVSLSATESPDMPPYINSDIKTKTLTKEVYVVPKLRIVSNYVHNGVEMVSGDDLTINATTNLEVTHLYADFYDDSDTKLTTVKFEEYKDKSDDRNWTVDTVIPDLEKNGDIKIVLRACTNFGGKTKLNFTRIVEDTITLDDVIALRLLNYRITDIVNHTDYTYPIAKVDCPVPYKTGYYVTFRIDSKGKPTMVKAKMSIDGSLDEEIILRKLSADEWEGKYFADADLKSGKITTNLTAFKGTSIYNFNSKESWDGHILDINGSAFHDARINRTN